MKAYAWIIFVVKLLLLFFLTGCLLLPILFGSEAQVIHQVDNQVTDTLKMNTALLLLSSKQSDQTDNLALFQTSYASWKGRQQAFLSGSVALHLPPYPPRDLLPTVFASQPVFQTLQTAYTKVLTPQENINKDQLAIILTYTHSYLQSLTTLESSWEQDYTTFFFSLFIPELILICLLLLAASSNLFLGLQVSER